MKLSREIKMDSISLTYDEKYEFIKLYDILRDMDFELSEKQVSVFEKIQEPTMYFWEIKD